MSKEPENTGGKTAVIGHPISHSKSPLIHNYWLQHYGLNGQYKSIDIHPDHLNNGIEMLIQNEYCGFNVTIPHKITIMDLCDEIDGIAQKIGAVNTVTIKGGKLFGTNSDAYGFIENIKSAVPEFDFTAGRAIILGAGGAARAIIYGLLQEGTPEIITTNRTRKKSDELCAHYGNKLTAVNWDERSNIFDGANIIINTTSLGMVGKSALEIDLSQCAPKTLVTDIVYTPLHSDLLKQAQNKNLPIVTGIGMLLHQARQGFNLWNGQMPEVTPELEKLVLS